MHACLPPGVEVEDVGLVLDIEVGRRRRNAATVEDPPVLHHCRAAVHPEGRYGPFACHLVPLKSHQV